MSIQITSEHIIKKYGGITIIPDLSLTIKTGEFFTLLGPSGCGKTTFLRMIAGFISLEGGSIYFDDRVINDIPAQGRNIGMVFQNYAIFPHLTVRENVAYGLRMRKVPRVELRKKVDEVLRMVRIEQYADRLPEKLSGGQQQRVALARAIVIHPSALLMDEPLSNLDAKLRVEMRSTIRELQKNVGITTVYVTHDQEEALAISDRIAVMNNGEIQQVGQPLKIYLRPANTFVSTFIGFSNLFASKIRLEGERRLVVLGDDCMLEVPNLCEHVIDGQEVIIAMRPDEFSYTDSGLRVKVINSTFLGQTIKYQVSIENASVVNSESKNELTEAIKYVRRSFSPGEVFCIRPITDKINVFTADGKENLIKDLMRYEG
jgi:iron(III) transport system ATP-binding protein